jgi:hypothetical protein
VLQLSSGVTDLVGNPIDVTADKVYFAASFGNVFTTGVLNNWKKVNANDRGQVVLNYTTTPTPAQALAYDVWLQGVQAGRINANDTGQIVLSYSATDLDNLVVPACPLHDLLIELGRGAGRPAPPARLTRPEVSVHRVSWFQGPTDSPDKTEGEGPQRKERGGVTHEEAVGNGSGSGSGHDRVRCGH